MRWVSSQRRIQMCPRWGCQISASSMIRPQWGATLRSQWFRSSPFWLLSSRASGQLGGPGTLVGQASDSIVAAGDPVAETVLAAMQRARDNGGDARRVAEAIARIADNPRPRLHYRVGSDATWFPIFHYDASRS